jgi:4-hydroxy-tetrahydrodipicolinate reductase
MVGRDVGAVVGANRTLGFPVTATLGEAVLRVRPDVVLHATNSYFDLFKNQIIEIIAAGFPIVSTSEEMSFPWLTHPEPAAEIDTAAKRAGVCVLATGVNPGFLMDSLPLNLTAICQRVDHIEVRRIVNASRRRGPFQAKIGAGMTVEQFRARMTEGRMGHVGLPESVGMVFDTLGKKLVRYESSVEPLVAEHRVVTQFFEVPIGRVIGLKQVAKGCTEEGEFMSLTFQAALDQEPEQDTILVKGKPDLEMTLKGSNGDIATIAIAVNAIRRVLNGPAGLVTMRDLPMVTIW